MKNIILIFVYLFIISNMMYSATFHSKGDGSLNGSVTDAGVATGGGFWADATTWQEGAAPTATDDAIILSGDLVKINASASITNLTVLTGGIVQQGAGATGTGTFTLASGSWWYAAYGSATKLPQGFATYSIDPNSNWIFTSAASSSLINSLPALYGNVFVYKPGSILAASTVINNINIQGNLTIKNGSSTSAVKGANNKSDTTTIIHVGGNVNIISGILSGVDAVVQTTSCTYNIDGNVTVGDPSPLYSNLAALAPVSAADAGYQRTGIFNIKGNLSYINGAKFEAGTNGTSTNVLESAVINLKGNLATDASVVNALNSPGTFSLNFVGSSNQIMTLGVPLDFSPATAFILNINNSAGVTLNSSTKLVRATLNLSTGNLSTTSSNLLILGSGSSITGGSTSSFVNGPMAFANKSISPVTLVFPVGKGANYSPVTLYLTQSAIDSSVYIAELFNSQPVANILPGTLDKVSSVAYYVISESSGGSSFTNGSILLNYSSNDGVTDAANLRIAKGSGTGTGTWTDLGGTGTGIPTGTITSTISFIDLTTNTIFTYANHTGGSNPLPVELSSFTLSNKSRSVQINWTTSTENNCSKFEIERTSAETIGEPFSWVTSGSIPASGSSTSINNYSFTEKNLQSGRYLFRLKIIDYDGSYKFSSILGVEIALPKSFDLSQNYPNPFNPSTKIDYALPSDSKINIEVYSINGAKIIQLVNEDQSAGYYSVDFNSTLTGKNISSGVYLYRFTAVDNTSGNNYSIVKKMMLLK
ncbi:MAG: T9SS type A sorting domain-containing protein [Ignavibacteriaceae bacterium]|nr:T9SS type A sorting domain-containing protein [Ignavibacteriaceae bacterium]